MSKRARATLALAGGALATTSIFVTAQQRPNTQSSAAPPAVVLTGCLENASDATDTFLLRVAPPTAGTSAAAGTSATGDAPSGQVTGQTPTGATATSTATPTPSVGTPEATANPASPAYNRPSDGPGATVSAADTIAQTGVTLYRIEAARGIAVGEHVGRLVEVHGTWRARQDGSDSCCAALQGPTARAHEPEAKQPRTETTGTSGSPHATTSGTSIPTIAVTSVRRLGPTCPR